jgi:hypothetical protein
VSKSGDITSTGTSGTNDRSTPTEIIDSQGGLSGPIPFWRVFHEFFDRK